VPHDTLRRIDDSPTNCELSRNIVTVYLARSNGRLLSKPNASSEGKQPLGIAFTFDRIPQRKRERTAWQRRNGCVFIKEHKIQPGRKGSSAVRQEQEERLNVPATRAPQKRKIRLRFWPAMQAG
jgi:hypothetical protein